MAQLNFLLGGQSNGLGFGLGGPSPSLATRVKVWNNENPLGANGTAFVDPVLGSPPLTASGTNNLGIWFAHRATRELDVDARGVIVARGSSDISWWHPTTGAMFAETVAVYAASGLPPADVFLWHQGETGEDDNTQYKSKWLAMRAALVAAGAIRNQAPCILGGLQGARIGGTNDTYLQELAAENAGVYYASSAGLGHNGDELHFSGSALYILGYERYWEQYRKHIGFPAPKSGELRLFF